MFGSKSICNVRSKIDFCGGVGIGMSVGMLGGLW